jgi:hypothetical protein
MVRAIEQIQAVCAVLVLGMAMALGVVALSEAAPFGGPAVHQMVEADPACADAAYTERHADDCSAVQACCGACAVVALETAGVPARPGDAWGLIPRPVLSGLVPLVNRHPPRVHA